MIAEIRALASEISTIKKSLAKAKASEFKEECEKELALRRIVIPVDSQKFGEKIEQFIKACFNNLNIMRVDGKTSNNKTSLTFLERPDEWIALNKPDVLIYTTSAESGINIGIKNYFGHRFAFFFGVSDTNLINTITQMLGRVRDDIITTIWVNDKAVTIANKKAKRIEDFKSSLDKAFSLKLETILEDEIDKEFLSKEILNNYKKSQNIHYEYAVNQIHQGDIEKHNLRELTIKAIESKQIPIERYTHFDGDFAEITAGIKTAKEKCFLQDATDIFNAPEPIWTEGKFETNIPEHDDDYWAGMAKAKFYNKLPEIADSAVWSTEFINLVRNQAPALLAALDLELKVREGDSDLKASKAFYKMLAKDQFKNIWNIKDDIGVTAALRAIGILELIDNGSFFKICDELPQRILKESRKHPEFLGAWPEIYSTKEERFLPVKDSTRLAQLLANLAYKTSAQKESTGQREYVYKITRAVPSFLIKDLSPDVATLKLDWFAQVVEAVISSRKLFLETRVKDALEKPWKNEEVLPRKVEYFDEKNIESQNRSNELTEIDRARPKLTTPLIGEKQKLDGFLKQDVPLTKEAIRPEKLLQIKRGGRYARGKN